MNMNDPSEVLQPITVKDILRQSVQLYRNDLLKFLCIVLLVKGPYLVLGDVIVHWTEILLPELPYAAGMTLMLIRFLELLLIGPILAAPITIALSGRLLGREIGVAEAYKIILRNALPLFGTILLTAVIISAIFIGSAVVASSTMSTGSQSGSFLIMIGAVLACVLWVRYGFIAQTVVLESEGGFSAMKRSKHLVKGNFLKTFALLVLVFIALSLIAGIVSFGIDKALSFLGEYGSLLSAGGSNVVSVLLEPLRMVAITLLYFDYRVRKEGFDLEILAEELEASEEDERL